MKRRMVSAYTISVGRILASLVTIAFFMLQLSRVDADTELIEVGNSPVLNIQITTGTIVIRTWNKPQIAIEAQGNIHWQHYAPSQVAARIPAQFSSLAQTVQSPRGQITLAPEIWVLPPLSPQPHDGIVLRGGGNITVTIPAGTALVAVRLARGNVALRDYHDGIFFSAVHTGGIVLQNVTGTGFAQTARGTLLTFNSSFDRLRARTGAGNMLFENVDAKQISVSSVRGSIVYDDSSFQPGLARFESEYGNVALGIRNGGAQIGAHSEVGHILTNFSDNANVTNTPGPGNSAGSMTDIKTTVGNGAATVTASTMHGTILLYDGSLRQHPMLLSHFPGIQRFYQRSGPHAPQQPGV